jgi:hypothetical protein
MPDFVGTTAIGWRRETTVAFELWLRPSQDLDNIRSTWAAKRTDLRL